MGLPGVAHRTKTLTYLFPCQYPHSQSTPTKIHLHHRTHSYTTAKLATNREWALLNLNKNAHTLLLIAGIEPNPGPNRQEPHNRLSLAHVNINSITAPGKFDELQQFVDNNNVNILALSETKTDNTVDPCLYKLSGFHSPLIKHRTRHGGGTAIYAKSSLPITRLPQLELDEEEWIWCKITLRNATLAICCLYLPPKLQSDRLDLFLERFTESVSMAHALNPNAILITGDFNAGNIYLRPGYTNSGTTAFDHKLKDAAFTLGLHQLINQPTRLTDTTANLRDLIFTSNDELTIDSGILSQFSTLDHFPVFTTLNISTTKTPPTSKTIWDYEKLDADRFTRLLMNIDWRHILSLDIDTATSQFTSTILSAAKQAIPTKTIRVRQMDKPWVTNELKRNIRKRDRLFKTARHRPTNDQAWDRWRQQRNLVTDLNRRLKQDHLTAQIHRLLQYKHDPYKYHQLLRNITGRTRRETIPPLLTGDGRILTTDEDIATVFNDHFASQSHLAVPPNHTPTTHNRGPVPTLNEITTTPQEVLKILNSLDPNKSCGPDQLPAKIIKLSAIIIAEPLSELFNNSFRLGIFPEMWKEANIHPIFKKKGSQSDPTNYRPISLLSILSKVMEKIVFRNIYDHLLEHQLLSDRQSGYRPHHSTQLQLTYLCHNLYKSLDLGHNFTAIFLDISKYFDKIWHFGLIHKCKNEFGITGSLLTWIKSYLHNRKHRVEISSSFSCYKTINAGCPQGSVLGPLLALLYLNELSNITENNIQFFADDTTLHASHTTSNFSTIQRSLQNDLDKIFKYGQQWIISFNPTKTVQLTLSNSSTPATPQLNFGGQPVPTARSHKHLGITFSQDLRFHDHINDIILKVNKSLSPIYPIATLLPRPTLDLIYRIYIRPHFDYCDIIYDGNITVTDSLRLERLQNRVARLVTGTLRRTSTDKLRQELGWDSLKTRRDIHKLNMYYELRHPQSLLPTYITSIIPNTRLHDTNRTLRNANTQTLPINRITSFQNSFVPATTRLWNTLPIQIRNEPSTTTFKKEVRRHLGVPTPPLYFSFGTKIGNSLHTRLRVGMSRLNAHLFPIQLSDRLQCECGSPSETVNHFILNCPLYQNARNQLFRSISINLNIDVTNFQPTELTNLLLNGPNHPRGGGRELAYLFQSFLRDSGRFS